MTAEARICRILVVDDDRALSLLVGKQLEREGHEVVSVSSGADAISWLANGHADLMLLDLRLPDMTGRELLESLAASGRSMPFVVMTGYGDERMAVEMMKQGASDYMVKDQMFLHLLPSVVSQALERIETDARLARAETALQESEARYRQVIESLPVVFISFEGGTNRVLLARGAVDKLFGYDHAFIVGDNNEARRKMVHPDDAERVHRAIRDGLASMKPFDLEYRIIHGHYGGSVWLYQRVVPIAAPDGSLLRQDSVILDITQQKESEAERQRMHIQLLQAQKLESLGVLAGGIAHDFNNLLTIISGNAQYLARHVDFDPEHVAVLKDIEIAATHAAEMTRSLQAFSRPAPPQIRPTDANRLVSDIYRLLRRMIPTTIDFQLDLDKNDCAVAVDPAQMQQVLVNLCVNARDAMPTGGRLDVQTRLVEPDHVPQRVRAECEAERYVRIRVTDDGCGMEPRTLEQAFDPFFTTKSVGSGTGLGLHLVRRLVHLHLVGYRAVIGLFVDQVLVAVEVTHLFVLPRARLAGRI